MVLVLARRMLTNDQPYICKQRPDQETEDWAKLQLGGRMFLHLARPSPREGERDDEGRKGLGRKGGRRGKISHHLGIWGD